MKTRHRVAANGSGHDPPAQFYRAVGVDGPG